MDLPSDETPQNDKKNQMFPQFPFPFPFGNEAPRLSLPQIPQLDLPKDPSSVLPNMPEIQSPMDKVNQTMKSDPVIDATKAIESGSKKVEELAKRIAETSRMK